MAGRAGLRSGRAQSRPGPGLGFRLVQAANTAHVLRLNKADVLALNKAHVLHLNTGFGLVLVWHGHLKGDRRLT